MTSTPDGTFERDREVFVLFSPKTGVPKNATGPEAALRARNVPGENDCPGVVVIWGVFGCSVFGYSISLDRAWFGDGAVGTFAAESKTSGSASLEMTSGIGENQCSWAI